ncbi:MAG: hypothetical protein EAZ79_25015 [Oscillatoriales cyanobacterium]|nr:MAG: hypothetical protein EAZ79_25015 [Oscillatoriales cyanobacterium]
MSCSYYLPQGRVEIFRSRALKPDFWAPACLSVCVLVAAEAAAYAPHRKEFPRRFLSPKGCLCDRVCVFDSGFAARSYLW